MNDRINDFKKIVDGDEFAMQSEGQKSIGNSGDKKSPARYKNMDVNSIGNPTNQTDPIQNINKDNNYNYNPFIEALNITSNLKITPENAVSVHNEPELDYTLSELSFLNDICNNAISTVGEKYIKIKNQIQHSAINEDIKQNSFYSSRLGKVNSNSVNSSVLNSLPNQRTYSNSKHSNVDLYTNASPKTSFIMPTPQQYADSQSISNIPSP